MSTSTPSSDAPTHELERTALYDEHVAAGATLVDFHGWEMPIRYRSIPEEHLQVREAAGVFDLGHMGRLRLSGPGAAAWLGRILTNDVAGLSVGEARYSLICREDGGILDDAIVYRLPDEWLLVVNASNRARILTWLDSHRDDADAVLVDASAEWSMIAVQGPEALGIATPLLESPSTAWEDLRYYRILRATFAGTEVWVARTGYTGEDGVEVYLPNSDAVTLWRQLLEVGGNRIAPIGLGARDTLRLEAGMPLYGQEIDESTTPFDAGLGFAVKLDKATPFVGQASLRSARERGPTRRLRGFRVDGKRVARAGMKILAGDEEVGHVTSGAPSPSLGYPIAMGYLESQYLERLESGSAPEPEIDLRGRRQKLLLERLPFCSRTRKKGT